MLKNTELTITPLVKYIWELDNQIRFCEDGQNKLQTMIDYLKDQKNTAEEQLEVAISLIAEPE